jgi:hypothetical protein
MAFRSGFVLLAAVAAAAAPIDVPDGSEDEAIAAPKSS